MHHHGRIHRVNFAFFGVGLFGRGGSAVRCGCFGIFGVKGACLLACLLACLPAFLPACLLACLLFYGFFWAPVFLAPLFMSTSLEQKSWGMQSGAINGLGHGKFCILFLRHFSCFGQFFAPFWCSVNFPVFGGSRHNDRRSPRQLCLFGCSMFLLGYLLALVCVSFLSCSISCYFCHVR